jgi:hypothetical protein
MCSPCADAKPQVRRIRCRIPEYKSVMYLIAITFCLLVLLRWGAARCLRTKLRTKTVGAEALSPAPTTDRTTLWRAIQQEALAWLLVVAVLGALFLLAVIYSYFFGGIPPIHEWRG